MDLGFISKVELRRIAMDFILEDKKREKRCISNFGLKKMVEKRVAILERRNVWGVVVQV